MCDRETVPRNGHAIDMRGGSNSPAALMRFVKSSSYFSQ
jgi:hypothetical protein